MTNSHTSIILFAMLLFLFTASAIDIKYYNPGDRIVYDTIPYMVKDPAFETSYIELMEMFNGEREYDLCRAEYLVENAYFGGTLNYNEFCHDIDSVVNVLNVFIDINNVRQYKTAPNFALFDYFTKPSMMNGYSKLSYDFEDPLGKNDFTVYFTSRLLRTHKGQCTSLSLLYKILCDKLGGQSALAFAPMHVYIKHIDENGRWVNIELTSGSFARDIWLIETLNVSTESIRHGIFLCALNDKETIAFMLMQLARAYLSKYNSYDYFIEQMVELVLNDLPNFCHALVIKFNLIKNSGLSFQHKYGQIKTTYVTNQYMSFKRIMNQLDSLGYSQPTIEEYNEIIAEGMRLTKNQDVHN